MIRRSSIFWGSVLVLLGGIFLVDSLGFIEIDLWGIIGPVLLILFGAWVLVGYFIKLEPGEITSVSIPANNSRKAIINIQHGIGKLVVESGGEASEILKGTFGQGVIHSIEKQGDVINDMKGDILAGLAEEASNLENFNSEAFRQIVYLIKLSFTRNLMPQFELVSRGDSELRGLYKDINNKTNDISDILDSAKTDANSLRELNSQLKQLGSLLDNFYEELQTRQILQRRPRI